MKTKIFTFLFLLCCIGYINAQKMTVATYNIRNDNPEDTQNGNGWQQRLPYITNLINYHKFDIFGIQEGFHNQLEQIKTRLPQYDYIGVGRDDGKQTGEYAAIFYDKKKFQLIKSGNFWLSQNPTSPNLGWDAVCIRICTWGEFKIKSSGKTFYFFNTHTDHVGVQARKESAKLILSKIKSMAKNKSVILTGDFNVDQQNESYTLLNTSGILRDSYMLSPIKYPNNGTFNAFEINNKTNKRIDHIFLTSDFNVSRYGILTDIYWDNAGKARIPSDHYPVVIDVELTRK